MPPCARCACHLRSIIDGALDEAPYRDVPGMSDFIQQEPAEGRPASDKTEIWLFYDDKNLYVGARMHEEDPARRVTSDLTARQQ